MTFNYAAGFSLRCCCAVYMGCWGRTLKEVREQRPGGTGLSGQQGRGGEEEGCPHFSTLTLHDGGWEKPTGSEDLVTLGSCSCTVPWHFIQFLHQQSSSVGKGQSQASQCLQPLGVAPVFPVDTAWTCVLLKSVTSVRNESTQLERTQLGSFLAVKK